MGLQSLLILAVFISSCFSNAGRVKDSDPKAVPEKIVTGADQVDSYLPLLKGKKEAEYSEAFSVRE